MIFSNSNNGFIYRCPYSLRTRFGNLNTAYGFLNNIIDLCCKWYLRYMLSYIPISLWGWSSLKGLSPWNYEWNTALKTCLAKWLKHWLGRNGPGFDFRTNRNEFITRYLFVLGLDVGGCIVISAFLKGISDALHSLVYGFYSPPSQTFMMNRIE